MREAIFYEKLDDNKVKCTLCPRFCIISDNKIGYCGTRCNKEGTLFSLIYGLASSVNVDPVEKKPCNHFYPGSIVLSLGTLGCNFRCKHCQNYSISMANPSLDGKEMQKVSPEDALNLSLRYRCKGISWTYNEPAIWTEYAADTAKLFKEKGLYTIYVTNGYITTEALDYIGPYLDCYRVDFKGFKKETYKKLANVSNFTPVLESTLRAKNKWNMHIEVVTNVIPTFNDDDDQLYGIARWIYGNLGDKTPWHVTRFFPYLELSHLPPTPIETLVHAREIGLECGLNFVYLGNISGLGGEDTVCPKCKKTAIKRAGYSVNILNIKNGKCNTCGEDLNIIGI